MSRLQQSLGYRGLRWHDYLVMGMLLPLLLLLSAIAIVATYWRTTSCP
jgi:hypothetical protein